MGTEFRIPHCSLLAGGRKGYVAAKKHSWAAQLYKITHVWYAASKARNQHSRNTKRQEVNQWTTSLSSDSASTADNLWCLALLSVPAVARRWVCHQQARRASFLLEHSQVICHHTRRRRCKRKMIHSLLVWPRAT